MRIPRLVALVLVALLLSIPSLSLPAQAATKSVSILDDAFHPGIVTVSQGDTVKWTNNDTHTHTSTSNKGFWTHTIAQGDAYSQTAAFMNAGTYGYHCAIHTFMTGSVKVPLKAPTAAANGFRLRWSSLSSTPSNRSFDVQKMAPSSSTWTALRTNTATRSAFLNPTRNGTWRYRARTDNLSNGKSSGWSPVKAVTVS
jgi:plastocyanin